ncbi:MAG: DUF4388 domain-containing protein [Gemmatimonadales bacterium]
MAIEGPLKELGLHDVFQLLDLSRKTGVMRVTSQLRDNEGMVAFDRGTIVFAEMRTSPLRIGELLLKAGRITDADLERARAIQHKERGARRLGQVLVEMGAVADRDLVRHVEFQVTEVVFHLLSWQEGFFSFREGPLEGVPADAMVKIRTEKVLMEGARRIDEWSRIEGHIAHLGVVPALAAAGDNGDVTRIDLLPAEWEVLARVDGESDVRQIAQGLARSEFEVARTLFGLASTGVVTLSDPGAGRSSRPSAGMDAMDLLMAAERRLESGDVAAAREAALGAAELRPGEPRTHLVLARVHLREQRAAEAVEEARAAARLDPRSSEAYRWLALALAGAGRFAEAGEQFTQWERLAGGDAPAGDRDTMRAAKAAAALLAQLLGGGHG